MIMSNIQLRADRFSDRKVGHLDRPAAQILSRNTTRGIKMKQIKLTQGQVAIVDDEDFAILSLHKWYAHRDGYTFYALRKSPMIKGVRHTIRMHRVILNAPTEQQVDHRDRNGLNNQRSNLRLCTNAQNRHNCGNFPHSSRFKGVSWKVSKQRWYVGLRHEDKHIYIGAYKDERTAARAYNQKAKELFGEFARLNKVS